MSTHASAAEFRPLNSLSPHPRNPRRIPPGAVAKVRASLQAYGWTAPLLVQASTGYILAGHTRRLAALEAAADNPAECAHLVDAVPVRLLDVDDSTALAILLADNRTGEESRWDDQQLAGVLLELQQKGVDVAPTGFEQRELDRLLAELSHTDPQGEAERAAAEAAAGREADVRRSQLPGKPVTQPGEVWKLGRHRLAVGDVFNAATLAAALDGLRADMVFTDPPYAIYGSATGLASEIADDKLVRPFFRDVLAVSKGAVRPFGHAYVCCDWRSFPSWSEVAKLVRLRLCNLIVWDKGSGLGSMYGNQYELVAFFSNTPQRGHMRGKGGVHGVERMVQDLNVWRINRVPQEQRTHNAQKPVELVRRAIANSSDLGDVVLDPFAGSGTTLITCEQEDRACITCEIDPRFADSVIERWQTLTGSKAEHAGTFSTSPPELPEADA